MKKIILLFITLILLTGCEKEKVKEKEIEKIPEEVVEEEVIPEWKDDNNTPISFYSLSGNTLTKLTNVSGDYVALDDIGLFQIYPSKEETISCNNGFPSSYHDEFEKYKNEYHVKVGFSLSFSLKDGSDVYYSILTPNNTMDKWEYFMAYLYDDYKNMGRSFYSHIEPEEYDDSTLFTAIKLQLGGYWEQLNSPILFQVFTYNSEDDFLDGHYRGNSESTMTICINHLC